MDGWSLIRVGGAATEGRVESLSLKSAWHGRLKSGSYGRR